MKPGKIHRQANDTAVTEQLAAKALSIAADMPPHRAKQGERRWPIADALPAARLLIGQATQGDREALPLAARSLAETLADPTGKVTDGFGHTRPSYPLLATHLLATAAKLIGCTHTLEATRQAAVTLFASVDRCSVGGDPRFLPWRQLIAWQHDFVDTDTDTEAGAGALLSVGAEPAPLAPLGLNDLIDSWTYNELVGLHGLHLWSLAQADRSLANRVRCASAYHLGHTQPDYTTYQPWALAAFASDPMTAVFAEQQLHDVATHLSIEGPGSAVIPALLLADNAAAMSGTLMQAWCSSKRS